MRISQDKHLYSKNNQHIVDHEAGVTIVERQEPINKVGAKVIIFTTEHLLAHARSKFRLEINNGTKPKIAALSALVVLGVIDSAASSESIHTP